MSRAPIWFWALAIVWLAQIAPGPGLADQRDGRLDELFRQLQTTGDAADAEALQTQIWQIWIEFDDRSVSELMRRGMTAMARGEYQDAFEAFDIMVADAPDFAEAWNKRATVLYLMGRLDESVRDIRRTLELEPRHFGALSGLALIYDAVEQPAAAIRSLEAALAINPHLDGTQQRIDQLREKLKGIKT